MLLYLDIDGVMVPANSWRQPVFLEDGFPEFSARSVKALNNLIASTNASIVLTTSHKHKYSVNQWGQLFKRRQIAVGGIMRLPENTQHLNRREELLQYFNTRKVTDDFLIIDDDKSLNALPPYLKNRLLQTSASVGLTEALAEEAIARVANGKLV